MSRPYHSAYKAVRDGARIYRVQDALDEERGRGFWAGLIVGVVLTLFWVLLLEAGFGL